MYCIYTGYPRADPGRVNTGSGAVLGGFQWFPETTQDSLKFISSLYNAHHEQRDSI